MDQTSTPPAWHHGDAYDRFMGRWSRQLAPRFLHWLQAPPSSRWLDVGCGTGSLTAAIFEHCAPAEVTGVDPSAGFLATAQRHLPAEVTLHCAAADRLPLADAAVDRAVSALVLNFVPDTDAALREMSRVTSPGGQVAACVWDYAGKMALIRHYWDTAEELGLVPPGKVQGERFPLCQPDALAAAFTDSGLQQVEVSGLEIEMHFADFDDYWQPFLGGQGPAPAHAMSLDEEQRTRLRELIRERIPVQADGSLLLAARVWAARGSVAH